MAKGTSVKGVAALGLVCDVNAQRYSNNIKWVLPLAEIENSPTNVWLKQNRDAMLSLEAALKSTQYKLAQLRIHKRDVDKDKFKRELGLDGEEEEEEEYQGRTRYKFCRQSTNFVVNITYYFPTGQLDLYDEVAEKILSRRTYHGRGSGGQGTTNRLRLVCNDWFVGMKKGRTYTPVNIPFSRFDDDYYGGYCDLVNA